MNPSVPLVSQRIAIQQISCRSIKVNGVYMVIKAYRTSHEVVFRAYDPLNCEDLRVVINTKVSGGSLSKSM